MARTKQSARICASQRPTHPPPDEQPRQFEAVEGVLAEGETGAQQQNAATQQPGVAIVLQENQIEQLPEEADNPSDDSPALLDMASPRRSSRRTTSTVVLDPRSPQPAEEDSLVEAAPPARKKSRRALPLQKIREDTSTPATTKKRQSKQKQQAGTLSAKKTASSSRPHDLASHLGSLLENTTIDHLQRGDAQKAKICFIMATNITSQTFQDWVNLVKWLEDKQNHDKLIALLHTVYPAKMVSCGDSLSHEEAVRMLRDGFVYDVVRELGSLAESSGAVASASYQFLGAQRKRKGLAMRIQTSWSIQNQTKGSKELSKLDLFLIQVTL